MLHAVTRALLRSLPFAVSVICVVSSWQNRFTVSFFRRHVRAEYQGKEVFGREHERLLF